MVWKNKRVDLLLTQEKEEEEKKTTFQYPTHPILSESEQTKNQWRDCIIAFHVFQPFSWYFYISNVCFLVFQDFTVLLDLYCLVKCSYNHSLM